MIRSVVSVLAVLIALTGCSLFGDEDNSEPPVALESFDKRVHLRSLWSRSTGDGTEEQLVKLVPKVVDERVYVADRNGSVWAYELEKGTKVWRSKTGVAISAGPGVGEGLVLVGSSEAVRSSGALRYPAKFCRFHRSMKMWSLYRPWTVILAGWMQKAATGSGSMIARLPC